MALGLPVVVVFVLCASLSTCVLAWNNVCKAYTDSYGTYHGSQNCFPRYCCGTCDRRECCNDFLRRLPEVEQDGCYRRRSYSSLPMPSIIGIVFLIVLFLVFICCCVCPCCTLYKMCRKPRPVVATTTNTTVVTTTAQQYPQQPSAAPGPSQPHHGVQYAPYQPMPVQPGYGTQGMPTSSYQGQPFTPGPPPTYQEATGPAYLPQPMPYSQAAYGPGQPPYPLQPPAMPQPQPQPNVPPPQLDYLAQPAYNPDFVAPPRTG